MEWGARDLKVRSIGREGGREDIVVVVVVVVVVKSLEAILM